MAIEVHENERYGKLLVLKEVEPLVYKNGRKYRAFECLCDCGNKKIVLMSKLSTGSTKSCGCYRRERISESCRKDLTGKTFGMLTVLQRISDIGDSALYECLCECGEKVNVRGCNLVTQNTTSCGCYRKEVAKNLKFRHGLCKSRIYQTYMNMKKRCYDPNNKRYANYGGRGITICSEWLDNFLDFYEWAIKNGYNDNLTIDRIDNDKGYEPSNCRWISLGENSKKRNLEYWGKRRTAGFYQNTCLSKRC